MAEPEADEPAVDAPDPIVGHWRSIEVTDAGGSSYTVDFGMTIEEDLTGEVAVSIFYDWPGTMYDENYDYTLTLTAEALGGAKYRIGTHHPNDANSDSTSDQREGARAQFGSREICSEYSPQVPELLTRTTRT